MGCARSIVVPESRPIVDVDEAARKISHAHAAKSRMFYPMHVMHMNTLLDLKRLEPHQRLLKQGRIVEWSPSMMGYTVFVSHEWLGRAHPDPKGDQLRTLQAIFKRLASGKETVEYDFPSKLLLPSGDCKPVSGERWAASIPHSHVWLDYMSVPQIGFPSDDEGLRVASFGSQECDKVGPNATTADHRFEDSDATQKLMAAVNSIPEYITHCSLMIVLTPVLQHTESDRICNYASWRDRGWCRLELTAAVLARNQIRIMTCIGPSAPLEFSGSYNTLQLPALEGNFTCCALGHVINGKPINCDKDSLRNVISAILDDTVRRYRDMGNYEDLRYLECSKPQYSDCSTGTETSQALPHPERAVHDSAPPFVVSHSGFSNVSSGRATAMLSKTDTSTCSLTEFKQCLHWRSEDSEAAQAGKANSLLHWACIANNAAVVRELLATSGTEELERPTATRFPTLGFQKGRQPLILALGSPTMVEQLLDARANPEKTVLTMICNVGTVETLRVWLDRFPSEDLTTSDVLGLMPLHQAAYVHPKPVQMIKELIERRADPRTGTAAYGKDTFIKILSMREDSSVEALKYALAAGCDPNATIKPDSRAWKLLFAIARLLRRCSKPNSMISVFAHMVGQSPLHCAACRGDVNFMRILIEAKADAQRRTQVGETVMDQAKRRFRGDVPGAVEELLNKDNSMCSVVVDHAADNPD